jgi:DNA mismatch endonuclease (patch repair protein)
MADVVSPAKRSQMMSGIRGKDTKPEMLIRKALHRRGFRYSLHRKQLPGKPDLVLRKFGTVVFVHGCFWHGHECRLFKWPKSNTEFWQTKISGNQERDKKHIARLLEDGWRVIVVWECALRGKTEADRERLFEDIAAGIKNQNGRNLITYEG